MAFTKNQYDVVLIQPPAEVIIEQYDKPNYPAIGIAYIGNYLEINEGITPVLVDARLSCFTLDETVDKIVALRPKIVGISAMTHMIHTTAKLAGKIKKKISDIKIVLGGVHGTFLPERTLNEFPVFDFIVIGEGAIAFSTLVRSLLDSQDYQSIKGVCFKENGQIINNQLGEIPDKLDELGEPGWHLFDQDVMKQYCTLLPVISQRGCPYQCNFCSRPFGSKVRKRSPDLVAHEIKRDIENYGDSLIEFYDETFALNKNNLKLLCNEFRKNNMEFKYICNAHAGTVDEEMALILKYSGCIRVKFGVESGNENILKEMGKGITKEKVVNTIKIFKRVKLETLAFFIFGHPNETPRSIFETIKFAIKVNADINAIGIMIPYPGTKIWELAKDGKCGYKRLSLDWEDYNKQLGNAVELESVSRKELILAQIIGYSLIYIANFRFVCFFKMIKDNLPLSLTLVSRLIKGS